MFGKEFSSDITGDGPGPQRNSMFGKECSSDITGDGPGSVCVGCVEVFDIRRRFSRALRNVISSQVLSLRTWTLSWETSNNVTIAVELSQWSSGSSGLNFPSWQPLGSSVTDFGRRSRQCPKSWQLVLCHYSNDSWDDNFEVVQTVVLLLVQCNRLEESTAEVRRCRPSGVWTKVEVASGVGLTVWLLLVQLGRPDVVTMACWTWMRTGRCDRPRCHFRHDNEPDARAREEHRAPPPRFENRIYRTCHAWWSISVVIRVKNAEIEDATVNIE